jgi:large subunit ribosomal protein L29
MKENADKARNLDAAELAKQLREGPEQIFRLRFQLRMGQMDGLKKMRSLRKERARLLTVQRERELGQSAAPEAPTKAGKVKAALTTAKAKAAGKPKAAAAKKKSAKGKE